MSIEEKSTSRVKHAVGALLRLKVIGTGAENTLVALSTTIDHMV